MGSALTRAVLMGCFAFLKGALVFSLQTWALADVPVPPERFPEVRDPVTIDAPIFITKPGRKRLNRDCRAKGTAFVIAAPNVTIDGNGHVVEFNTAGDPDVKGIHLYVDGSWAVPDMRFGVIRGGAQAINAKVENLVLRQGSLSAPRNNGVGGYRAEGLRVSNTTIEVGGEDSCTVAGVVGNITLTNNVLVARVSSTANRHQGPANVKAIVVVASGNVIIGGNSGINARDAGSFISKNIIMQDSFATNGYGIWLYEPDRVVATDNIILPISGRGILLNGSLPNVGSTERGHNNTIERNVILAREKPNPEFGDSLNANGIRIRHNSSNNVVARNHVLAVGGNEYCGASGLYLSVGQPDATSAITNNTFNAIVSGTPDAKRYAKGLALERNLDTVDYGIDQNKIQSNHMIISTSGYDGAGRLRRPMVGNTLNFVDGRKAVGEFQAAVNAKLLEIGMADNPWAKMLVAWTFESLAATMTAPIQPAHRTFYSSYYAGDEHVTLLNTIGNAGLDLSDVFVETSRWPGLRRFEIGRQFRVQAIRQGKPLAHRSIIITMPRGLTLSASTDEQGFFDLPAVNYWLGRVGSAGDEPYTRGDSGFVQISLNGTTKDIDPNAVPKILEF